MKADIAPGRARMWLGMCVLRFPVSSGLAPSHCRPFGSYCFAPLASRCGIRLHRIPRVERWRQGFASSHGLQSVSLGRKETNVLSAESVPANISIRRPQLIRQKVVHLHQDGEQPSVSVERAAPQALMISSAPSRILEKWAPARMRCEGREPVRTVTIENGGAGSHSRESPTSSSGICMGFARAISAGSCALSDKRDRDRRRATGVRRCSASQGGTLSVALNCPALSTIFSGVHRATVTCATAAKPPLRAPPSNVTNPPLAAAPSPLMPRSGEARAAPSVCPPRRLRRRRTSPARSLSFAGRSACSGGVQMRESR